MEHKEGEQDTLDRPADKAAQSEGSTANKVMKARQRRDPCNNPGLANTPMCRKNRAKQINPKRESKQDIYGPGGQ